MDARKEPDLGRQVGVEGGTVLLDLLVVDQGVGELMEVALAGTGVRPAEYAVYSQLGIAAMSPGELSARLGIAPSTLTGMLRAVAGRGHTRRTAHPRDGRSHRLELTPAGRRTLELCRRRFRRALTVLHDQLDEDPARVRAMLVGVDEAIHRAIEVLTGGERARDRHQ